MCGNTHATSLRPLKSACNDRHRLLCPARIIDPIVYVHDEVRRTGSPLRDATRDGLPVDGNEIVALVEGQLHRHFNFADARSVYLAEEKRSKVVLVCPRTFPPVVNYLDVESAKMMVAKNLAFLQVLDCGNIYQTST